LSDAVSARAGVLGRIASALRAERDEAADAVLAHREEFPTYANLTDAELRALRADVLALVDALCTALAHDRPLDADDVAFLVPAVRRRMRAGGSALHDTGQGLRILQSEVYQRVARIAGDVGDPRAAVGAGARLLELIDVAATLAGEAWVEASELFRGAGARRHRELLERVLSDGLPRSGPLRELGRELGLVEGAGFVVVSGRPAASTDDRHVLSAAVGALSRAGDPVVLPAAAAIGDEVIVVRTVREEAVDELVGALERAWRRLADGPVRLAIGVGTRHVLPAGGREALAEARLARDHVPPSGGLLALPRLAPLAWLARAAGAVSWRLVPEAVTRFLSEDAEAGGALLLTFRGYTACDLNIKLTAQRMNMHVNTVRYRLGRIEERTGLDLRRYDDVLALDVAARLFEARGL